MESSVGNYARRSAAGMHKPRTGTLWDHFKLSFAAKDRPRDLPLLQRHFFTDTNIAMIEKAI